MNWQIQHTLHGPPLETWRRRQLTTICLLLAWAIGITKTVMYLGLLTGQLSWWWLLALGPIRLITSVLYTVAFYPIGRYLMNQRTQELQL